MIRILIASYLVSLTLRILPKESMGRIEIYGGILKATSPTNIGKFKYKSPTS